MKNSNYYKFFILVGAVILILGVYLLLTNYAIASGQILGLILCIGSGIFGLGLSGAVQKILKKHNPNHVKQLELEDERNIMTRTKAEEATGKFINYTNMVFCLSLVITSIYVFVPYWIILSEALIVLAYPFFITYYTFKN